MFLVELVARTKAERKFDPFYFGLLGHILQLHADRAKPVRDAAAQLAYVIATALCDPLARFHPVSLKGLTTPPAHPQQGPQHKTRLCTMPCIYLMHYLLLYTSPNRVRAVALFSSSKSTSRGWSKLAASTLPQY